MAQDTILDTLVINQMTKAQYDQHKDGIGENELVFITDEEPSYVAEMRQDIADMEDSIDGLTDKVNDLYDDYLNASSLL